MKITEFITGINDFTFNLYRGLSVKEKGNLICSPKNISDCFAMLYAAARSDTAASMRSTMNFPNSCSTTLASIQKINALLAKDTGATIKTANAVWKSDGYPFSEAFEKTLKEGSGANLASADFTKSKEVSDEINEWVGKQTLSEKGEPLIKDLVKPEMFNKDTVMALVSAIYFFATFKEKFNEGLTRKQPFNLSDGQQSECQMMVRQGDYMLAKTDDLQMIEIPYAGDTVLNVILPTKQDGLADIEANMSSELLQKLTASTRSGDTVLMLPKFKIESDLDLKESLSALGMEIVFTDEANFRGAYPENSMAPSIKVSKAVHKAVIDTTEKGTEAAAATAVVMMKCSAMMRPEVPRRFIADRPFMYVITHRPTGAVLFVGRHDKPAGY
jgi:serpin B